MKKVEITINGVAYPCGTLTMGALLRFERETGKNAMAVLSPDELKKSISFTDMGTLMWACAASATRAEGSEFKITCMDFLDACPPEIAGAWLTNAIMEQAPDKEDAEKDGEGEKKPDSVTDLMGFALSIIGLAYDDFYRLQMREFTVCCKAFNEQRMAEIHSDWERMRMLATIVIQPHIKGRVTPDKLLPFEWEKAKERTNRSPSAKRMARQGLKVWSKDWAVSRRQDP